MPRSKRSIENAITLDGHKLVWWLHREQQLTTEDGWKGLAIHVRAADRVRRELHLEYPVLMTPKIGVIGTDRVVINIRPMKVLEHIRCAMADGWDPESRGGQFVYELDELPN
jgi:hypothetical protein